MQDLIVEKMVFLQIYVFYKNYIFFQKLLRDMKLKMVEIYVFMMIKVCNMYVIVMIVLFFIIGQNG